MPLVNPPAVLGVNVRDFGAAGDGLADDAAAINAAVAYIRSSRTIGGILAAKLLFPQGVYRVRSTLDFTSLRGYALTIDGDGAAILGETDGAPVVDAFDTRWSRWRGLTIVGGDAHTPNIGLMWGRIGAGVADNNSLDRVMFAGKFTLACHYNFASETCQYDHCNFSNGSSGAGAYAVILDGYNHFGVSSAFAPQTLSANTAISFAELQFNNPVFVSAGGPPLWLGGLHRPRIIAGYALSLLSPYAAVLWTNDTGTNWLYEIDLHAEAGLIEDVFLLSGPTASPTFAGFRFRDHYLFATDALFKLDTGVTSASVFGLDVIVGALSDPTAVLVANPSAWTLRGNLVLPSAGFFNATSFVGPLMISGAVTWNGDTTFNGGNLQTNFSDLATISAPGAPAMDRARLYADKSGGKVRLMVRFPSGAAAQIAVEP